MFPPLSSFVCRRNIMIHMPEPCTYIHAISLLSLLRKDLHIDPHKLPPLPIQPEHSTEPPSAPRRSPISIGRCPHIVTTSGETNSSTTLQVHDLHRNTPQPGMLP